jgi:hypothetical protein
LSNITLFSGANVPAFAKRGELSPLAKMLAGGGASGKRVSIKGGVFRLLVDGQEVAAIEERHLDVVIVNAASKIGRTFYMKAYDSDAPSGPDCWSADGEKPDSTAANPQANNCASCPQNVKGSGQGESRACRYSQRLAVVLANDVEGDVMQLQLPATSIFGKDEGGNMPLQAYARFLAAQNVSPETVVTRMKFDTKSEAPKIFFKAMRWLTEDEYSAAVEQGQSEDAKRAITMTVAQTDKVEPMALEGTPPKAAAKAAAKPAPVPAEEDEPPAPPPRRGRPPKAKQEPVEEETVEPTVVKQAAPAPAAKPSLAKLAAEWDDEG